MREATIKEYLKAGPAWLGDIAAACGVPFGQMETVRSDVNRMIKAGSVVQVEDQRSSGKHKARVYYKLTD